jgi:hypothetical protein
MKSILDPKFKYRNSANTDLRKTFARERRRLREEQRSGAIVTSARVIQLGGKLDAK